MNVSFLIFLLVGLAGPGILFLIGEIHAYHRSGKRNPTCTYAWVRAMYHTFNLDRIRW